MLESLSTLCDAAPFLARGALITTGTVVIAMVLGFILGLPLAVLQVYASCPIRRLVSLYVWFFRGVPILVLLFLFYFGLAFQLGMDISPFGASCIVLGCTSAAYQSQIFRGSINSVPQGQMRAALALGMRKRTAIGAVILPQALRLAIPGWTNEYSILLKDSALVSVLGTMELMARTRALATSTSEYAAFYCAAAFMYFFITFVGVRILRALETRTRIPGYSASV